MPGDLRVGVIGAGWFASRRHLPALRACHGVTLAALCRRDAGALHAIAEAFEIPRDNCYEDWQQMLDSERLDAVLIATPHALHFEQGSAALNRGLHVLMEKPLAVGASPAWELAQLASERGLVLATALNPPYWAHCHRMRELLCSGELGQLESASLYWTGSAEYVFGRAPKPENLPGIVPPTSYRSDPALNGGGYFIDGGSHLVSELLWVTGLKARRVTALMDALPTDMRCALAVEMENGSIATINAIGDSRYPDRRVRNQFGASQGEMVVTGFEFSTEVRRPGIDPEQFTEAGLPPVDSPVANFIGAVRGEGALYSDGRHGASVAAVIEAAYRSQETGSTQEVFSPGE